MYTLKQRSGKRRLWWLMVLALAGLAGAYSYWAVNRPLPELQPNLESAELQISTAAPKLAWPTTGQAAVGILDSSILQTHGKQTAAPTASTAKLITALVILRHKPLKPGQQGPTITLTADDVAIYNAYMARNGSLTKVQAGERISQYQMLQAVMLPSANNISDSLAIWAFGSLPAYSRAANQYLKEHGLTASRVGTDASGYAPSSVSTARDLVKIGKLAMQNPVLASIVNQKTANLPVAGTVKNVNFLLGSNNIIGIKTGNTDEAGGVFVSASRVTVNGQPVTIVTAVTGSPSLFQALKDSLPLIQSAQANFAKTTVVKTGQVIASYKLPWGGTITAAADKGLSTVAWRGSNVKATAKLRPISLNSEAGQNVGSLAVSGPLETKQKVDLKLSDTPTKPSIWWRLTHPL